MDNNPLECDCGITPSLWTAEVTGTCAYPPHLRGVEINTLQSNDFKCGQYNIANFKKNFKSLKYSGILSKAPSETTSHSFILSKFLNVIHLAFGGCEGDLHLNGNTRHFRKTAPSSHWLHMETILV